MRPLAEERQQHIAMRMAASLHVTGDDVRLRQVFSNWLLNATKYTPSGGEIEIDGIRDGERVIVTVTDTGRGISPSYCPGSSICSCGTTTRTAEWASACTSFVASWRRTAGALRHGARA